MKIQLVLPDRQIQLQRQAIEFDALISEMKQLIAENPNPWIATNKFDGSNWLVASFGEDEQSQKWSVTTDHVRVSEFCGSAEGDARFCALAKRIMPELISRLEQWRPK